ncbi:glycosyltransferase family 4 protein [Candidatus Methylomirabilis sp.]|uniref:glycosyltransferase family 4 protein n=1 Tax=Candidatus Methylomirabilis sp. TaxID=2032687 RepID=UPI0030764985
MPGALVVGQAGLMRVTPADFYRGSMRLIYLLEGTESWGGVKAVLEHANGLTRRGHRVQVLSKGQAPTWFPLEADFRQVPDFAAEQIPIADYIIGTYWTTVPPAVACGRGIPVHFCQGYEADYFPDVALCERVEAAYRLPTLKVTIRPHLKALIETRYGQACYDIGYGIDLNRFNPEPPPPLQGRYRILVVGPWEWPFKGIPDALQGLKQLKTQRRDLWVVRASQLPQSEAEAALDVVDEYHQDVNPYAMPALYRRCHLFISASTEAEGFGLPAMEAMACGLPCVLTRIPSYLSFDDGEAYASFVPLRDPLAISAAVDGLLNDLLQRAWQRTAGLKVAARYPMEAVVERLEALLLRGLSDRMIRRS